MFRSKKCEARTRKQKEDDLMISTTNGNIDKYIKNRDKSQMTSKQVMSKHQHSESNNLNTNEENDDDE